MGTKKEGVEGAAEGGAEEDEAAFFYFIK